MNDVPIYNLLRQMMRCQSQVIGTEQRRMVYRDLFCLFGLAVNFRLNFIWTIYRSMRLCI